MTPNFNASREDFQRIVAIVNRARSFDPGLDTLSLSMDLEAVHCNGTPMDFDKLLVAPDFDFLHDIQGIVRHLDRGTGELSDHFLPRCARANTPGVNHS